MTAFDNITKAKTIWGLVLPEVPPPSDANIYRWLLHFTLEEFEKAVPRVIWRYRAHDLSKVDPEKVHRFVTSTLVWNRDKGLKLKHQKETI
jgi:hypothetical protein